MRLLLRADVAGLGHKGDVVEVADGYARNFLVPRGMAIVASDGAERQAEAMRRSRAAADAVVRAEAEAMATTLVPVVVSVAARAGAEGKLFGSVTTAEVAEAVADQFGITLDRRDLHIDEPIREVGTHRVAARPHADVRFDVTIEVVPAD